MDVEAAYLEAALPLPVTLLHRALQPYSLGHEMILARLGSPFLSSELEPEFADLKLAVLVCSQRYDRAVGVLSRPDFDISDWNRQIGEVPLVTQRLLMSDFELYRVEGMRCPKFRPFTKGRRGRAPGAPFMTLLFYALVTELGFTRAEALNAPYGWAQWLYCTHQERLGTMAITSDSEENTEERINEIFKERGWERLRMTTP